KQFKTEFKPVEEKPIKLTPKPKNWFGREYPEKQKDRLDNWVYWSKIQQYPTRLERLSKLINRYYDYDINDSAGWIVLFNAYYYDKNPFDLMKVYKFNKTDHDIYFIQDVA